MKTLVCFVAVLVVEVAYSDVIVDVMSRPGNRVIKEVEIKEGKAGSTGYSSEHKPIFAFNNITGYWYSEKGNNFPKMIWYEFVNRISPAEVTFISGTRRYQFVGTNNLVCKEKSSWTILSQDFVSKPDDFRSRTMVCQVPDLLGKRYKCLGLRLFDRGRIPDGIVSVENIRMWKRV